MNDRQKISVRAIKVLFSVCDGNPLSMAKVPVLIVRRAAAQVLLDDFLKSDQHVIGKMTGIATDKQVLRDTVTVDIELGYDAINSYAIETKNNTLKEFSHYTPTALDKMTGEALVEVGKNLKLKINEITVGVLHDHGYDPVDLTDLDGNLTLFDKALNTPEQEIKEHKVEVDDRDKKFDLLTNYMKNEMDSAAKPLKKKDPYFYKLYRTCRKLHLQGHRKSSDSTDGGQTGEFDIVVPRTKIVAIPFQVAENKVYLFSDLGNCDLVYWTQATPDVPATVPAEKWKIVGGDEATRNSAELGFPTKVYLFVANESNEEDGEIAIDEVI